MILLYEMFKGQTDQETINIIFESVGRDIDKALEACLEMFGGGNDMADTISKFRQDFYQDEDSDEDFNEEQEEEIKLP